MEPEDVIEMAFRWFPVIGALIFMLFALVAPIALLAWPLITNGVCR